MQAKGKTTIRSMAVALLGMVLSCAMLFGATYAWFTNSVTTGINTIKTASFDVTLQYSEAFDGTYSALTDSSVLFNDVTLTPGDNTGVKYIKITNTNDYAVKASVSIGDLTTVGGNNELLLYTAAGINGAVDYVNSMPCQALTSDISILNNQEIEAGASYIVAIAVALPENATNPGVTTQFVITIGATQVGA